MATSKLWEQARLIGALGSALLTAASVLAWLRTEVDATRVREERIRAALLAGKVVEVALEGAWRPVESIADSGRIYLGPRLGWRDVAATDDLRISVAPERPGLPRRRFMR